MKRIVVFLFIIIVPLYSIEREYILGGDNWQPLLLKNIEINQNEAGENSLFIQNGEYALDNSTELLLHFNSLPIVDVTGNFRLIENKVSISEGRKKFGAGAALFNKETNSIVLDRNGRGFFPGRIYSDDFSIEFWVYGQNYTDGETIFFVDGFADIGNGFISQLFRCHIENRKTVWTIKNFFIPPGSKEFEVKISSERQLIPGVWTHHLLRYDSTTGLMEYLIDAKPESVIYATTSEREAGQVYPLYSGTRGRIVIGNNFTGLIDEFRFKLEWINNNMLPLLGAHTGVYISEPVDLGNSKSTLIGFEAKNIIPIGTDILYYYYLSDSRQAIMEDSPEWKKIAPGSGLLSERGGRFLRIKAVLYSDGEKSVSPSVSRINIKFDQKSSPPPPRVVRAEPGNSSVRLKWSEVIDPDIDGYYVYFGERSGKYFGSEKNNNTSPIDVGKNNEIIIRNLENGRIYYFAVVSYSRSTPRYGSVIVNEGGDYSVEVSARPLETYGDIK
ncbi:MAG: hypothetical protein FWF38_03170 [Spirochaetaceae bacterium]|nr:hypothetical protein [Spirochaetaceae bacterium]